MERDTATRATIEPTATTKRRGPGDPRLYQIAVLSGLLLYGALALELEIVPLVAATALGTALLTQRLFAVLLGLEVDYLSPLISGLSLCLLLRTMSLAIAALAALLAIASKFLVRRRGKHVFNPSALGLVVVVLLTDRAWVSPGQWGSPAFFGFLVAGLGTIVVHRAARSDVTIAFLVAWATLVLGRALWLGDPLAIPMRQMQSGALLLFAFFMISDPKTTPDSRPGRIVFAGLVALGAGLVQFGLYRPNGPLYALIVVALGVPWIDRLLPAERYEWGGSSRGRLPGAASEAGVFAPAAVDPPARPAPIDAARSFFGVPISGSPVPGSPFPGSPVPGSPVPGAPFAGPPSSGFSVSGFSVSGPPISGRAVAGRGVPRSAAEPPRVAATSADQRLLPAEYLTFDLPGGGRDPSVRTRADAPTARVPAWRTRASTDPPSSDLPSSEPPSGEPPLHVPVPHVPVPHVPVPHVLVPHVPAPNVPASSLSGSRDVKETGSSDAFSNRLIPERST